MSSCYKYLFVGNGMIWIQKKGTYVSIYIFEKK